MKAIRPNVPEWQNVVIQLPAGAVRRQVALKVASWKQQQRTAMREAGVTLQRYAEKPLFFSRKPDDPDDLRKMYNRWIRRERHFYAKVRIVRTRRGLFLVYGDVDDKTVTSGTGPFPTAYAAEQWFLNGGR